VALLLDFPIWTEDQDFLGSGVATWTTGQSRVVSTLNRETKTERPFPPGATIVLPLLPELFLM
jgi:PIN domain